MAKKRHYELTNERRRASDIYPFLTSDTYVYRIRATRDLPYHNVKAGDLGGWVQSYKNLKDEAWVADNAIVMDNAVVCDRALIEEEARIIHQARVQDDANVSGHARLCQKSVASGNAEITGHAAMYDHTRVSGDAGLSENVRLENWAEVKGRAQISGWACIGVCAVITGNTSISGHSYIGGHSLIKDVDLESPIEIKSNARIKSHNDILFIDTITSEEQKVTVYRTSSGEHNHLIHMGCWTGTIDELEELFMKKKWIDTIKKKDTERLRPEMLAMCQMIRARVQNWE